MAIYRIFPTKDAFISSEISTANTGKDEILEIGGYPDQSGIPRTIRSLIQFSTDDIRDVIDTKVGSTPFKSYLNLSLSNANELPVDFTIYSYPISGAWDEGRGKFNDIPTDKSGVSWEYRNAGSTNSWDTVTFGPEATGSFLTNQQGGGNWYTGSLGVSLESSQSFNVNSNLDLYLDHTSATHYFYSSSIQNNGFILKLQDSLESQTSSSIRLRYFGKDTNTIYPPFLEFKWNDSLFETGSLSVLDDSLSKIVILNNKKEYIDQGKQRFRIKASPTYPTRTFTTSSIYLTNYALPENSYWGLKDEHSSEMVIDFDENYTKVSCDNTGPYFDIYMDGLQPERYYRVLIKTTLDRSTTVIDNKNIFKIIRNG